MNKIAIIGAGNMGEAIIRGLPRKRSIVVSDKRKTRLRQLKRSLKINIASSNKDAVKRADIVILAVKPQNIYEVLHKISENITQKKLLISIAAGVTTKRIENALKRRIPVVRVMPNTPALVGMGMSVLCAGKYADKKDIKRASQIFSFVGKVIVIKKEGLMDAVTATSGSGPAYVYLFIESLINSGVKLGLSKKVSEELVLQTLRGAIKLLLVTGKTPCELRAQVTSPGGTTEAALAVFQKKGFHKIIHAAKKSAAKRSKELSKCYLD